MLKPANPFERARVLMAALFAAFCVLLISSTPSQAGLFDTPEPEILFEGTGPSLAPGVLVIRDSRSLEEARSSLDPDFTSDAPNLRTRTILRVVGRERENACRETVVREVETRMTKATVLVEERVPAPGCACEQTTRPPAAWLLTVSRSVRRADILVEEVTVPCGTSNQARASSEPSLLLENSWDEAPGAQIIADRAAFDRVLSALRLQDRGPQIDFDSHAIVAVTGQARSNGCRRTNVVDVALVGDELVVTLDEQFAAPNQMCTQLYNLPKVFLYRVPGGIASARVITQKSTAP